MALDPLKPSRLVPGDRERELFDRLLGDFVPKDPFDFHAHLYRIHELGRDIEPVPNDDEVGLAFFAS